MRLPEAADQLRTAPVKVLRAVFAGIGQLLVAADQFREEAEEQSADDQYDVFREWARPPASVSPAGTAQAGEPAAAASAPPKAAAAPAKAAAAEQVPRKPEPRARHPRGASERGAAQGGGGRRPSASAEAPVKAAASARGANAAARRSATKSRGPATTMGDENTMRGGKARRSREAAEPRRFRSLDSTGNVRVLTPEDVAESASTRKAPARPEPPAASPEPRAALPIDAYDGLSLPSLRSRLRNLDAAQLRVLLAYERSNARRDDVMGMFERRIIKLGAAGSDAT